MAKVGHRYKTKVASQAFPHPFIMKE